MFKRAKLRTKMFAGFFLVIALMAGVGVVVTINMLSTRAESDILATRDLPDVALNVETYNIISDLRLDFRTYGFTGDPALAAEVGHHLDEVQEVIKKWSELGEKFADPEIIKGSAERAKGVTHYQELYRETVRVVEEIEQLRQTTEKSSQAFVATVYRYLDGQDTKLKADLDAGSPPEKIKERIAKIQSLNKVIDLVNEVRVPLMISQVRRDIDFPTEKLASLKQADEIIATVLSNTSQEIDRKSLADITSALVEFRKLVTRGDELSATFEKVTKERTLVMNAVAEECFNYLESTTGEASVASEKGAAAMSFACILLIVGLIVACIVSLVIALVNTRSILNAVNPILERAKAIAVGDLTGNDMVKRSEDELGELTAAINQMSNSLKQTVSEVSQAAREVASAATEIASSSEEMASGMDEQSQQVTQISSAVEEMSASIVEVARKSSDASANATESGNVAEEGGKVVHQTIEGMGAMNQAVNASASSVQELGKRGEQIGQIIEVINDIADQTNLLALNAAIEAARAGEYGRGFAVVADEVRKLADRTTKATEEIGTSIQAIQAETAEAVSRMQTGTEQVRAGVERATHAGASLEKIVTSARSVAVMIQSIAAAAEEQSAASEQVSRNIESISAVTKQTSEGAKQAATAAGQLSGKAEQLQRLVSQFKLATTNH